MTILDALKTKKISISCGRKTLQYNYNNLFTITEYDDNDTISHSVEAFTESDAINKLLSTKVCKIINGKFSWRLEVDNEKLLINNPDYFRKLYLSLGYTIEEVNENNLP